MMRIRHLAVLPFFLSTPVLAQTFEPGQWRSVTTVTKVQLNGGSAGPADALIGSSTPVALCLTAEDLAARGPEALFTPSGHCAFSALDMDDGALSFRATCRQPGRSVEATMTGEGTYTATSYSAVAVTSIPTPDGPLTMEAEDTAERIGDC